MRQRTFLLSLSPGRQSEPLLAARKRMKTESAPAAADCHRTLSASAFSVSVVLLSVEQQQICGKLFPHFQKDFSLKQKLREVTRTEVVF